MFKKALNPVRTKGFDSKAQMRYLLMLLRKYPDKYSWVKDALRDHGAPATEGPLHTYWEPPYNISPETPSYVYTRRSQIDAMLVKFANKLLDHGKTDLARKIISGPQNAANTFWTLFGRDVEKSKGDQEALVEWFDRFNNFLAKSYGELSSQDKVEAYRCFGDKILDREVK